MHEFFNLTPTSLSTVLLWYVLAIGGGVGFVGLTIRLQVQGEAALTRAAQSGRQSKRRKAPVVTPPPVDPLHHAPSWKRAGLALYLTLYLLLISFGLGLAAPSVEFSCMRTTGQAVDCAVFGHTRCDCLRWFCGGTVATLEGNVLRLPFSME